MTDAVWMCGTVCECVRIYVHMCGWCAAGAPPSINHTSHKQITPECVHGHMSVITLYSSYSSTSSCAVPSYSHLCTVMNMSRVHFTGTHAGGRRHAYDDRAEKCRWCNSHADTDMQLQVHPSPYATWCRHTATRTTILADPSFTLCR